MAKKPEFEFIDPKFIDMADQKMAVVHTIGNPNIVGESTFKALYGSVYKLKFELKKKGIEFKVAPLCARWPDAHLVDKSVWTGLWALPVPEDTSTLIQKVPGIEVCLETWSYGLVAQILHVGPFSTEGPTVERLHQFISDQGYEIRGTHEENYLTRMDAAEMRTLIRYPVRKQV
jgi:hypothetical protein